MKEKAKPKIENAQTSIILKSQNISLSGNPIIGTKNSPLTSVKRSTSHLNELNYDTKKSKTDSKTSIVLNQDGILLKEKNNDPLLEKNNADFASDDDLFDSINFDDSFEFNDSILNSAQKENISPDKIAYQSFYRYKVTSVGYSNNIKQLLLDSRNGDDYNLKLNLDGMWDDTVVDVNDICNVIDPVKYQTHWSVTNTQGLLVVNPDLLVSSTTITGSLFCQRKSVLQHYFSDLSGKVKKPMVIGTFIHSVFQKCSEEDNLSLEFMKEITNAFLKQRSHMLAFYECQLSDQEIWKELEIYFPKIVQWILKNISKYSKDPSKNLVVDIEENIWSAKYGMKGKVDLTLQKNNSNKTIMPLELKTGKASFSRDHTSQVLLYTLMMSEKRETNIDKGLLLYIKEGLEKSVENNNKSSVMSIIKIRNELTHFLLTFLKTTSTDANFLPPVLENDRFCNKCEYLALCSTFSRLSNKMTPIRQTMKDLIAQSTGHLNDKDFRFFLNWISIILIEYFSEQESKRAVKRIVMKKSQTSIRNVIFSSSSHDGGNFILKFRFASNSTHKFSTGDPVIISSDDGKKLAIATGFIRGPIGEDNLSVSSEKPLAISVQTPLRLDANNYMKISISNMSLMGNLMDSSDVSTNLRRFIIHGECPSFNTTISKSIIDKIKYIMKPCNRDQRKAIMWTLLSKNYTLIKGYPGSGKTSCMVAMIRIFVLLGMKVLVSSYTHSAVVNILQKLDENEVNFMYLNGNYSVSGPLENRTMDNLIKNNKVERASDLHKMLEDISVVGVTCLSMHHQALSRIKFDLIIIDEAGQITLPISIMPLMKMKSQTGRFLLTGDLLQLPPLVRNSSARTGGLDVSLFAHLCNFNHLNSISELTMQYRMNREILKLCNTITYDIRITCANEAVADATITVSSQCDKSFVDKLESWKRQCLSDDIQHSVVFVSHKIKASGDTYSNKFEAGLVLDLVDLFIKLGIRESDIGIIAPYNMQKDLLVELCHVDVEINTIDQYQGKDKSIIIISLVRQEKHGALPDVCEKESLDILTDERRLNVALTRAKHKLVMVGNIEYLSQVYKPVRDIRNTLTSEQILSI